MDLGGNLGLFSKEVTERFGCRCRVVEASPAMYEKLPTSSLIEKYHYAIAGSDGPVSFYIDADPLWSGLQPTRPSETVATVEVEGITLERFVREHGVDTIDLLKVDIEGAETAMFDSMSDELLSRVSQITVEFHDFCGLTSKEDIRRIRSRLEKLGFYWINMMDKISMDVVIVNRNRLPVTTAELWWMRFVVRNVTGGLRRVRRKLGFPE